MKYFRFHLLTIDHQMWEGGFTVTITTNVACHLYLRYSDIFPRIHRKTVERRGLVIGWDARYCFAAYQHIEQNEDGDTTTHTFTWPGWNDCETRYFYFLGTMGIHDSVSESPIFWLHYLWAVPTIEILRPNGVGAFAECTKHPDAGQNFEKVYEAVPDDMDTYVYSESRVAWWKDVHHLQDHVLGTGVIFKLELHARCYGGPSGVTVPGIYLIAHVDAIDFLVVPDQGMGLPNAAWEWRTYSWTQNPLTEAPWTWEEIDALQAGFQLISAFNMTPAIVTQFFTRVHFIPPG